MKRSSRLEFPPAPGPIELDQISDADRAALRFLATNRKQVVEVGTFFGGSAEALLQGMPVDGRLTCIDTFEGTMDSPTDFKHVVSGETGEPLGKAFVLAYLAGRLQPYQGRVDVIIGESLWAVSDFEPESADMVFLDGAHDYVNVLADIQAWLPIVKQDGILCGHDYDRFGEALPTEKIEQLSAYEFCPVPIDSPEPLRGHEELLVKVVNEKDEQIGHAVNVHFGVLRAVRESFKTVSLWDDISSSVWAVKPEWKRN